LRCGHEHQGAREALIAEKTLESIHAYMVRGRYFGGLTEEELNAQWVEVYRAACTLEGEKSCDALMDLQCEFDLRTVEPPIHLPHTDTNGPWWR